MKRSILIAAAIISIQGSVLAQNIAKVNEVISAEQAFNRLVERKGIKDAFLAVAAPDGIVFRPNVVKITDFYNSIDRQPGSLAWQPKFARISAAGDLAFSAGPYIYQNGKDDTDKVFGDYVSVWHADQEGKLKLLIDLGIQHPEPEKQEVPDFKEPDTTKHGGSSKDPFSSKAIIMNTDKIFNHELTVSVLASYKEFLSPEGRYYFPGFEPISGTDKTMQFLANESISINAKTLDAGRSLSGDLAYSYGTARIRKGDIVSDYNYVRIWEIDASHRWNILLEVLSAVEQQ